MISFFSFCDFFVGVVVPRGVLSRISRRETLVSQEVSLIAVFSLRDGWVDRWETMKWRHSASGSLIKHGRFMPINLHMLSSRETC